LAKQELTRRRLVGLDRSGPKPRQTRPGAPLRPWTLPNAIGYARLVAIPVFLYIALSSGDGREASATVIFALVSWGDYADGMLARVTGQYSRMGALLDPVVDRLTILSGVVVCWHFDLLPHWALIVLAARELVTLVLAQLALRRGIDLDVNWLGRWAVWPIMAAIFFAMCFESWVSEVLLYIGLILSILATALYLRMGLSARR
jgi:cardiolipin synthase